MNGRTSSAEVLVRCKCGSEWALLQVPDERDAGETWECFRWLDTASGREVGWCPDCGTATSKVSTVRVGAELA